MINPGTGVDDVKYFAMTAVLTDYVAPGAGQRRLRAKVLKSLTKAVEAQAELRGACRDTDVTAATRVRNWLYST